MSEQVISYADLSIINDALRSLDVNMHNVTGNVTALNNKQDQMESELRKLATAFANFVNADLSHKGLQLAETRAGNLKQDLQIKYGYYGEIRRMATGILQGADTGVISNDTLRSTTEEIMLKAPGYWLAPALVALASWLRNDKPTAEKALAETLKRDDYKASLFFLLVMRRLGRTDAAMQWLERYFLHQNPHHLEREFITILEAVTTGVFPPAAKQLAMTRVKEWLTQLTASGIFVNEQKRQWQMFFNAAGPGTIDNYPLLKTYATNYTVLEQSMSGAKTHEVLRYHFEHILSSTADFSRAIKVQLDEILSLLVTNFDDEELPLQKEVRLNELIIAMNGDKQAAQAKMDLEEHIFVEKVDFLQMLTNAAFNPQRSGATHVTQALAVSVAQPWIVAAHDKFTIQNRSSVPQQVELNIDGFTTTTANGSDETTLLQQQDRYYEQEQTKALTTLQFPVGHVVIGVLVALLALCFIKGAPYVAIMGMGIGAALIWQATDKHKKAKQQVKDTFATRKAKAREVLRGCIAETVDYRAEYATEDKKAEKLHELLSTITPEDFSSVSRETRNITLN